MLKRLCFISGAVMVISACSLLGEFESTQSPSKPYFKTKSVAEIDPYWQRFYQLEQEIAQLKLKLKDRPSPALAIESSNNQSDAIIHKLRAHASKALSAIDNAIAAIDDSAIEQVPAANERRSPRVAIAGAMERDADGAVVKQITYSQPRQPQYNYSLVYVYPEPQPWNDMWARLESVKEEDKWRGSNPSKPSYFIYVGAYIQENDALARQENLMAAVGAGPELRSKINNVSLAANH